VGALVSRFQLEVAFDDVGHRCCHGKGGNLMRFARVICMVTGVILVALALALGASARNDRDGDGAVVQRPQRSEGRDWTGEERRRGKPGEGPRAGDDDSRNGEGNSDDGRPRDPSRCEVKLRGNDRYDSLQAAVDAASPGDTLKVRGTCVGTTVIDRNVTVVGQQNDAVLHGPVSGPFVALVRVNAGVTASIARLTLTGGGNYGGIVNLGTLAISDSTITQNGSAGNGGGIDNEGALDVIDSTISHNYASGHGGGIFGGVGSTTVLKHSSVTANTGGDGTGGIESRGSLSLVDSTIDDNNGGEGPGGISQLGGGTLSITRSSISGNTAAGGSFGGGIAISGGTATVKNSDIAGNFGQTAGGIAIGSGTTVTLSDTRVVDNRAPFGGGGIRNNGTLILAHHSTVTGNWMDPETAYHGGGIWNFGELRGAIPGPGGNVHDNTPDDIYPWP